MHIGNLEHSTTKQELLDHFARSVPNVVEAKIITDPVTKASKGFGFVLFRSSEEAQAALGVLDKTVLNGRQIKISHNSGKDLQDNRGGRDRDRDHNHRDRDRKDRNRDKDRSGKDRDRKERAKKSRASGSSSESRSRSRDKNHDRKKNKKDHRERDRDSRKASEKVPLMPPGVGPLMMNPMYAGGYYPMPPPQQMMDGSGNPMQMYPGQYPPPGYPMQYPNYPMYPPHMMNPGLPQQQDPKKQMHQGKHKEIEQPHPAMISYQLDPKSGMFIKQNDGQNPGHSQMSNLQVGPVPGFDFPMMYNPAMGPQINWMPPKDGSNPQPVHESYLEHAAVLPSSWSVPRLSEASRSL